MHRNMRAGKVPENIRKIPPFITLITVINAFQYSLGLVSSGRGSGETDRLRGSNRFPGPFPFRAPASSEESRPRDREISSEIARLPAP